MKLFLDMNKKTIISIYFLLWDIFCGFCAFVIFLSVFASVFYNQYINFIIQQYISSTLSPYINSIKNFKEFQIGINLLNLIFGENVIITLKDEIQKENAVISAHNKHYDDMFIYITIGIITFFLIILLLPILTKYIPLSDINFKYIILKFLLYLIFIVSLEILVLLYLLPTLNPLHLYVFFENMFAK